MVNLNNYCLCCCLPKFRFGSKEEKWRKSYGEGKMKREKKQNERKEKIYNKKLGWSKKLLNEIKIIKKSFKGNLIIFQLWSSLSFRPPFKSGAFGYILTFLPHQVGNRYLVPIKCINRWHWGRWALGKMRVVDVMESKWVFIHSLHTM